MSSDRPAGTTRFDVWLDSGATVEVPAGTDPDTPDGHRVLREAARRKLRALLDEDFELGFEQTPPLEAWKEDPGGPVS